MRQDEADGKFESFQRRALIDIVNDISFRSVWNGQRDPALIDLSLKSVGWPCHFVRTF